MRKLLALLAFVAMSAQAQTCTTIGNQVMCSNGVSGTRIGNQTIWNGPDGSSTSTRIGNQTINSNGTTATDIGNQRIFSNGVTGTRIGNQEIYSNGVTCTTIGNQRICN